MIPFARSREAKVLAAGVDLLRASFEARGFTYHSGTNATSSGGPFATGHFRKGSLEISLIVRNKTQLGCPNYSEGNGYAGHDDIVRTLGFAGQEALVHGEQLGFVSRSGGDAFEALGADLSQIVFPELDRSETSFREALARAVKLAQASLGL